MEFEYRQQVIEFTILAIIGLWLTTEFENWQQVIEFTELQGPYSGENLAATVDPGIGPSKPCFLICTADFLQGLGSGESGKRRDSYIRYLGRVLEDIASLLESDKGILRSLGSGSKMVY
ncbi:hypothetical protein V8E54_013532 [Elaphomyces granulatus]